MGWSIDVVRPELDDIFKEAKRYYRLTHPQSASVSVIVEYSGDRDLPIRYKSRIVELLPDFVYVQFINNATAPENAVWDNKEKK